jgi:hypothetical protein
MTAMTRQLRMNLIPNHIKALALSCFLIFMLPGCSTQKYLTEKAGDLLSKETLTTEDDLELLMHASAYHLKLSESLLKEIPHHLKLSESVTRGFTQYAFVFLMDEADRIENESIKKSTLLRIRAAKMLIRAKSIGLETLKLKHGQLGPYLQSNSPDKLLKLDMEDVGLAYWVMTSWAGAISLSKDNPDVVADLPQVFKLANLVWQTDPKFDQGALASMMGTLELAKPGNQSKKAEDFFNLGIEWRGQQIAPLVSKAENWAVATQNKDAFIQLLNLAIQEGQDKTDLTNTIMTRRAKWLLESTDNLF